MSKSVFTISDCPTPYAPWMEGATLPEIFLTIPLKPGEDLTGVIVQMILTRSTADPLNPDILEKTLIELENVPSSHWKGKVDWVTSDLIVGIAQNALFILTTLLGKTRPVARWNLDVFPNTDPTP